MAGTRSPARETVKSDTSSPQPDDTAAGTKRKADETSSPQTKRTTKAPKKQTTIEETIGGDNNVSQDQDMKDAPEKEEADDRQVNAPSTEDRTNTPKKDGADIDGTPETKTDNGTKSNNTIEESREVEKKLPSNILEKGLIYFFSRNRVGIEDADSVGDLQRSYFVLRPLPAGAKLGDGAIPDLKNNRLFALPKKYLPKSHSDRFMAFVEKADTTIQDLKDNFFKGSEYETKTQGTRYQNSATPMAEGVYAITRTDDRTTHLAYSITIPSELGEVQEDLGLRSQGSFIVSVKNPERKGPASAQLPQRPDFPKEIIEEFRGLAWAEVKPKYLDYANCQILLIGESFEKGVELLEKDQKHDKDGPKEVLEELEHEDELRVNHLHGDDTVFDDLNMSKKDFPQVPTTW